MAEVTPRTKRRNQNFDMHISLVKGEGRAHCFVDGTHYLVLVASATEYAAMRSDDSRPLPPPHVTGFFIQALDGLPAEYFAATYLGMIRFLRLRHPGASFSWAPEVNGVLAPEVVGVR